MRQITKRFIMKSILAVLLVLSSSPSFAGEVMWLEERATEKAVDGDTGLEEHGYKELLAKVGDYPKETHSTAEADMGDAKVYIYGPDNTPLDGMLAGERIKFSARQKGSHRVFVIKEAFENNVLDVVIAKAKVYNSKGDLLASVKKEIRGKTIDSHHSDHPAKDIPFEVIMEKTEKKHRNCCGLYSGDMVTFKTYYKGKPLSGGILRVTTERGWSKTLVTSADGSASLELIRDSYSDETLEEGRKRKEGLLVEASYTMNESGTFKGKTYDRIRYTTTFPLSFYPSPLEYSAKLPGFLSSIGVMLACGLGIFYYRTRKKTASWRL